MSNHVQIIPLGSMPVAVARHPMNPTGPMGLVIRTRAGTEMWHGWKKLHRTLRALPGNWRDYPHEDYDPIYTKEAAKLARVSPYTIISRVRRGRLMAVKTVGQKSPLMLRRSEIKDWTDKRRKDKKC